MSELHAAEVFRRRAVQAEAWSPLFDALPLGVFVTDAAGVVLACSDLAASLVDDTPDAILGRRADDVFVAGPQRTELASAISELALGADGTRALELQLPRVNEGNLPRYAQVHLTRFEGSSQVVVTIHDIAARRAAVVAIRDRTSVLRQLLDGLREAVLVLDGGGRVVGVNRRAEELLSSTAEALLGSDGVTPALVPLDDDGATLDSDAFPSHHTLRTGEQQTRTPIRVRRLDGHERWLEVTTRVLDWQDGRPQLMVVSLHDVTEAHRAAIALRYRLDLEATLAEISTLMVSLPAKQVPSAVDQALGRIGRFLEGQRAYVCQFDPRGRRLSQTFEWTAGVPSVTSRRNRMTDRSMPWWLPQLRRGSAVAARSLEDMPDTAAAERELFGADGVKSFVSVPMVSGDRLTGVIGVERLDVSRNWSNEDVMVLRSVGEVLSNALERSRVQAELEVLNQRLDRNKLELERTNDQLLQATHAKDEFLSVASHELRTPLTSILGFVETLRDRADELRPGEQSQFLTVIHRQSTRLFRLVDDLLETSRLSSGRAEALREHVELSTFVRELIAELPPEMVIARTDVPDDLDVVVDPEHLRRMILNLLENARKYGDPPVWVSAMQVGEEVEIRVRDHGAGVSEAFVPRLWEKFSQASEGSTRAGGGAGLGLAIVRDLAILNGGTAEYEASEQGACFLLRLRTT